MMGVAKGETERQRDRERNARFGEMGDGEHTPDNRIIDERESAAYT